MLSLAFSLMLCFVVKVGKVFSWCVRFLIKNVLILILSQWNNSIYLFIKEIIIFFLSTLYFHSLKFTLLLTTNLKFLNYKNCLSRCNDLFIMIKKSLNSWPLLLILILNSYFFWTSFWWLENISGRILEKPMLNYRHKLNLVFITLFEIVLFWAGKYYDGILITTFMMLLVFFASIKIHNMTFRWKSVTFRVKL